jgi:hypothetical protein
MLRDIGMENAYAGICGISAKELTDNFEPELNALAERTGMTYDEAVAEMKKRYDGYHFCEDGEGMFNPFSVLNTLAKRKFFYYWFKTGTPTFLVEQMKKGNFDPMRFAEADGLKISVEAIDDYRVGSNNSIPLLYQSGYLTISGYDKELDEYILAFPNEEVKYGFLKELLPAYTYSLPDGTFSVNEFLKDLRAGNVDGFMTRMRSFFAAIPYELNDQAVNSDRPKAGEFSHGTFRPFAQDANGDRSATERHYQLVFFLVFTLLGQYARAEVHGSRGRADAVVETTDAVYVFEFKLNGTAEEALKQIDGKDYAVPYEAGNRRVVKIGAEFDKGTRNMERWLVDRADSAV